MTASKGVWMMNVLFSSTRCSPYFLTSFFGSGLDPASPAYHLRANVWFQRDLNHIWHQGNLIGNGRLLFCRWGNDVNNEGGQDHDGIMKCGIWVILTTFQNDKTVVDSSARPQQYIILMGNDRKMSWWYISWNESAAWVMYHLSRSIYCWDCVGGWMHIITVW